MQRAAEQDHRRELQAGESRDRVGYQQLGRSEHPGVPTDISVNRGETVSFRIKTEFASPANLQPVGGGSPSAGPLPIAAAES
jgi:hypothetical protein